MFVYNLNLNNKKIIKFLIIFLVIAMILLIGYSIFSILNSAKKEKTNNEEQLLEINDLDFTSFLKNSHEKMDEYLGKEVKISGYIYRMPDFNENQFVLSRTMILDSNNGVVVGILSEYEKAKDFNNSEWVTIKGKIIKGNYNGEIPAIQVEEIEITNPPENEYVYPPSSESKS